MRFIEPKTDFAFKKIFGSAGHEGILRSFLNAILYGGRDEITDLQLQDPYNVPRLKGLKESYLDVRVRQQNGKWILVEMQVVNVPGFEKRILFNAAKQFSNQVFKGQDYDTLDPVVLLTITDFVMFQDWPKVQSRYRMLETERLVEYPVEGMELVFVELPKFTKSHNEAVQLWEKWVCFMKEAGSLKRVPRSLAAVPQIQEAFEIANYAALTRQEADLFDNREIWWHDQRKLSKLYQKQQQDYDQTQQKLNQAQQERDQAQQERDQAQQERDQAQAEHERTLRKTVLALRQSGMHDTRICEIMGLSPQCLQHMMHSQETC
ncbi:MAG: Rpn family recombination-promoting nuclease/putative transposase [Myxococcota bacterium]